MRTLFLLIVYLVVDICQSISPIAQCGTCNVDATETNLKCLNKNTYISCPNTTEAIQCPSGQVCRVGGTSNTSEVGAICGLPNEKVYDCERNCRGFCSQNEIYICLGTNKFRICALNLEFTCPSNQICTIDSPCADPSKTNAPLCPDSTPTSTTTSIAPTSSPTTQAPSTNPCNRADINTVGKYNLSPPDPYCSRYLICDYIGGQFTGRAYSCTPGFQFNNITQRCTKPPVLGCSSLNSG